MSVADDGVVLVTGADGFAGRAVVALLRERGHRVRELARRGADGPGRVVVADLAACDDWSAALDGVRVVVHLAGRAHQVRDTAPDPAAEYRRVNVEGTRRLARAAAAGGVRRFVFASTVKVNGERTGARPFRGDDPPHPVGPYAESKLEAEAVLRELLGGSGTELVIFRPPLMYGPGVRANFLSLLRAVHRGVPLPLGRVRNARTLLYVGNFADAVRAAVEHPGPVAGTFLLSDGRALSTAELAREIGAAVGRAPRLVPVPVALLRAAGVVTGRSAAVGRLLDSLVVDDAPARSALGWAPPYSPVEGLRATAEWLRDGAGAAR